MPHKFEVSQHNMVTCYMYGSEDYKIHYSYFKETSGFIILAVLNEHQR
jgi:hypothetical protein